MHDLVFKIALNSFGIFMVVGFTFGFVAKAKDYAFKVLNFYGLGRR